MSRDIWLDDDQPGCLECGALVFRASRVGGVCDQCIEEASSVGTMNSSRDESSMFDGLSGVFDEYDGEDALWVEN